MGSLNPEQVEAAMGPSKLMTADDLAERWQLPKSHIYRLARLRVIPVVVLGKYRRFRLEDIIEFERNGGTG